MNFYFYCYQKPSPVPSHNLHYIFQLLFNVGKNERIGGVGELAKFTLTGAWQPFTLSEISTYLVPAIVHGQVGARDSIRWLWSCNKYSYIVYS